MAAMLDIFVSYTASDREWAEWIGHELEALGHKPHLHDWEISGGEDIAAWMEKRHHDADRILCVISKAYLDKPYSSWERRSGQWAAMTNRPGFVLPVLVERCELPTLFAPLKQCELYGIDEEVARARITAFLTPAAKPTQRGAFPGSPTAPRQQGSNKPQPRFPGTLTISNIPISVPRHFVGRDDALAAIATALADTKGPVTITTLHGLRGVGKTTLAAAYAERHRSDYRATWWIRAQTSDGMRADLVALGVRLRWVTADEKEEPALKTIIERLRDEGTGILLIYDNAIDADGIRPYIPSGGATRVLVTSNSPAWRTIAEPVEIKVWPKEIGADYLIARTGRNDERQAAEELSDALGGLPLAHEQAAAYCERLGVLLANYLKRFETAPARLLDDTRDAPSEYHDRTTVAKTFELAIDEATKLYPAAEPLIVHAALLAPEPIPLFLFAEARNQFDEPLASALAGDGLDEAVAALRAFALVERESIQDERDPAITTHCIRLHRLVRQIAQARHDRQTIDASRRALFAAMAAVYPQYIWRDPATWPRVRRLDPHVLILSDGGVPPQVELLCADLLIYAAQYKQYALAVYANAKPLFERALALREKSLGVENPITSSALNNLAGLLHAQGDLTAARNLYERSLAICEKTLGPRHPETATRLNNLANVLNDLGELAGARRLLKRAVAINEKVLGKGDPSTATTLNNLAHLLQHQGDLLEAQQLYERALAIQEKALGPEHPETARALNNLASVLKDQGNVGDARSLCERALMIFEKALGPKHPSTNVTRGNLAFLRCMEGQPIEAVPLAIAALSAHDEMLGPEHPLTRTSAELIIEIADAVGLATEAEALRKRYGIQSGGKPKRSTGRSRKKTKAGSTTRRARRKVR
jgi:tetratricopeptide (TPR) repeat protein